ncbi:MAG: enolase C-terminal domain-like protein [Candidatus Rokuibacteriota bacterium]
MGGLGAGTRLGGHDALPPRAWWGGLRQRRPAPREPPGQTRIPIAAGQNEGHKWRHRELLVHEAVDIVQPNVVYVGGYTEAVKVAAMAQAYHLPVANGGGWPHHNMHLIAGVSNGWRVEFHLLMWITGELIFREPPAPVRGSVTLTERPGLGLEPNEDVLRDTREP